MNNEQKLTFHVGQTDGSDNTIKLHFRLGSERASSDFSCRLYPREALRLSIELQKALTQNSAMTQIESSFLEIVGQGE